MQTVFATRAHLQAGLQLLHLPLQHLFQLTGVATVQLGQVQLALAVLQGLAMLQLVPSQLTDAGITLHHALQQVHVLTLRLLINAAGTVNLFQEG